MIAPPARAWPGRKRTGGAAMFKTLVRLLEIAAAVVALMVDPVAGVCWVVLSLWEDRRVA